MSRRPHDYYPTPAWCVRRLLEALRFPPWGRWLEPSAGDGAIIRAVHEFGQPQWTAVELREECAPGLASLTPGGEAVIADFLRWSEGVSQRWNVAILNPPFSAAEAFTRRCLDVANHVFVLERLNWIEGQERNGWLRDNPPDVYVLPERPSFTGDGTDSCAYAWFVWGPHRHRPHGRFHLLPMTPKHERRVPRLVMPEGVGREQGEMF